MFNIQCNHCVQPLPLQTMTINLPEIAKIYFHFNPKVFEAICKLNAKANKSLFKTIISDDEINFFSWLTEMKFGIFFDSRNFELDYNPNTDGQAPDWKLKRGEEIIYAEVLRLNLTDSLMYEKVKDLRERYINRDRPQKPEIEIRASGEMSMRYFYGKESKLTDKESKYRSLIVTKRQPFILCIDCSESRLFLDYLDFQDYFIGAENGFFYTDKNFGENISGILIRTMWNEILFLNNPNALFAIESETLQYLNLK